MSMSGAFPIEQSSYYKIWLMESGEIAKNQWYLGEKNHGAVTWEYAQCDSKPKWGDTDSASENTTYTPYKHRCAELPEAEAGTVQTNSTVSRSAGFE